MGDKPNHEHDAWEDLPDHVGAETYAISGAYDPGLSGNIVVPPIFLGSTFVADDAKTLAHSFDAALGKTEKPETPHSAIYTRVHNHGMAIAEARVARWEGRGLEALSFASGMAAISTLFMTLLKPGDTIIVSEPVYGGTHCLLHGYMVPHFGLKRVVDFPIGAPMEEVIPLIKKYSYAKILFVESPSNPIMELADIQALRAAINKYAPNMVLAVDNTINGPVHQKAIALGADVAVYSATKILNGHADTIKGFLVAKPEMIRKFFSIRTIFGNMSNPFSAWQLSRSLQTLDMRAERLQKNVRKVMPFLFNHHKVIKVFHPESPHTSTLQQDRYNRQCTGAPSLLSFTIDGDLAAAYRVINACHILRKAVSLGGVESMIQHPQSMTHSEIPPEMQAKFFITENMIRVSVGAERPNDIITDLSQALDKI